MRNEFKALFSGLATYVPGHTGLRETGGANSARYCYSVWMRHLAITAKYRNGKLPRIVCEIGPGRSLGVGLCALISGVEKYIAIDAVPFALDHSNLGLAMAQELEELFMNRSDIPAHDEFPRLYPKLTSYDFLIDYGDVEISKWKNTKQIIEQYPGNVGCHMEYHAPMTDVDIIGERSVDFLFSQATMEHVNDLENVYKNFAKWLSPDAIMSHQIDFKSHGYSTEWNGHWVYPDWLWKVIVGRRPFLINRAPLSQHIKLIKSNGFVILEIIPVRSESRIQKGSLSPRFRSISDDDFYTSSAAIIAKRLPG